MLFIKTRNFTDRRYTDGREDLCKESGVSD
jgi:hypothetical protein